MQTGSGATTVDKLITEALSKSRICTTGDRNSISPRRLRRFQSTARCQDQYSISIKPRITRSSSLSDLTGDDNDYTLELLSHTKSIIRNTREPREIRDASGDVAANGHDIDDIEYNRRKAHMSSNPKSRKQKTKENNQMAQESSSRKMVKQKHHAKDYYTQDSSSIEGMSSHKDAAFPFESTPSGHLKINSNQVAFQSSTVGILLADPANAKIKVKMGSEYNDHTPAEYVDNSEMENVILASKNNKEQLKPKNRNTSPTKKNKSPCNREDKGKDLKSLGYGLSSDPVDWKKVQVPNKSDLLQELYSRITNLVNTDTVVNIGNDKYQCHRFVLEVYSEYFTVHREYEIELPKSKVTSAAFHSIYEWMIKNGVDSSKVLTKSNVLEMFCAAQYLDIKDLKEQCWSFMMNEQLFEEDTAFALYREARAKGVVAVMESMVPRVRRFFLPLVASTDFLELEPDEVMTLLQSNLICVTSEIEVLMAGVRWLYGDWPARRQHTIDVMRCVRFGHISPWQLVDVKRNPDNAEVLDIVNDPDVQQMVDDGLAFVIIKYWDGNNSSNYYHWIDVLGLSEPAERNWIGEETNHVTYKDFLKYLEQFMIPKEQMYHQLATQQPYRKSDDVCGSIRGMDKEKMEMRRQKFDFPLPAALKGFPDTIDFPPSPDISRFGKVHDHQMHTLRSPPACSEKKNLKSPPLSPTRRMRLDSGNFRRSPTNKMPLDVATESDSCSKSPPSQDDEASLGMRTQRSYDALHCDPPVKEAHDHTLTDNSASTHTTKSEASPKCNQGERRQSIAACFLAEATAALSNRDNVEDRSSPIPSTSKTAKARLSKMVEKNSPNTENNFSPRISLFNDSKEFTAKLNMNKLSISVLGPINKCYTSEGSLFNSERETVLVFGGIDPHAPYGVNKNTGKDIYRFDPVMNVWDVVGELPEPRHHHSVAFLKGRVYLVGGADPRDDDIRGSSVVVSTVWSFEPVSRAWFSESGLATPRKNFGLVVHKMALYAIGGQDKKGKVLRSVEKFDPKAGSWSEVRPMGTARMAVAAAKYRDYIWVAGGMTGLKKRPLSSVVECYNSKTDQWTEIHSMRLPRCFATLFAMNDKLFLVGGAGRLSDKEKTASSMGAIDVWQWKERAWTVWAEMSIPRHGHALAYLGTQLIIIGGVTTIYMRALSNVESYCCERDAWIRGVSALPSPLSGHGAVTLPPASLM